MPREKNETALDSRWIDEIDLVRGDPIVKMIVLPGTGALLDAPDTRFNLAFLPFFLDLLPRLLYLEARSERYFTERKCGGIFSQMESNFSGNSMAGAFFLCAPHEYISLILYSLTSEGSSEEEWVYTNIA